MSKFEPRLRRISAFVSALDGDALLNHCRHTLEKLGKKPGTLALIFGKAQNKLQDPACGTGGALFTAHQYVTQHYPNPNPRSSSGQALTRAERRHLKK